MNGVFSFIYHYFCKFYVQDMEKTLSLSFEFFATRVFLKLFALIYALRLNPTNGLAL